MATANQKMELCEEKHFCNVNTLCRACRLVLSNDALDITKHDVFLTPDLVKKLVFCTSLNVEPQDGCPKYLCEDCYSKVIEFYQFQTMCVESAKFFGELLQEFPSEEILEDEQTICELLEIKVLDTNDDSVESEMDTEYCNKEESSERLIVDEEVLSDDSDLDIENSSKEQEEEVEPNESHTDPATNTKKFSCKVPGCNLAYKSKSGLRIHTHKVHPEITNPVKYFCKEPGCNYAFKYKTFFNKHLFKVHNLEPEPELEVSTKSFVCESCGEAFRHWKTFKVHRYRHKDTSERPFVCDDPGCERRFILKSTLNTHKLRHADIKKFVCPQCGLRKTTSYELKKHMNYHTQERTWPCPICKKDCNSANNLKVHERNEHGRAKDFECRFCAKTFVKSATLKYHEMSHTGEKPIVCTECGKRYLERHRLLMHMKKNHKDQLVTAKVAPTQSPKSKCS